MEIQVLLFESPGNHSDVAGTAMLQHEGVQVTLIRVENKKELVAASGRRSFDLVLFRSDHLVDRSDDESLRRLLFSGAAPYLLLSETDDIGARAQALAQGAWDVLPLSHPVAAQAIFQRAVQHAVLRRQEAELRTALDNAETVLQRSQKSIALGLLLGSIAHEINNPLEGLANLLYLAKRSRDEPEYLRVCLDMSESELDRVSEITKQMLSFHRDSRTPQEVALTEVLDGITKLFAARLREKQISVVRQYETRGWMTAYPGELRQAFVNLVANAVDAMEKGGTLTLRVSERGETSPRLCVTVADSGSGMSREMLDHLGELFFTTKGEAGTGLGLWVTRRILSKYDGSFRAYSSRLPGRSGTVFKLCFPAPHARLTGNTSGRTRRRDTASAEDGSSSEAGDGPTRRLA